MRFGRSAQVAVALLLTFGTVGESHARAAGWRTVARERNLMVMMRDVPGRSFPTVRAVATINASIYDVLAVLSDVDRYPRWMERCSEARRLERRSDLEYLSYTRTDAPWPVSDRDAVYHVRVRVKLAQKLVMVRFRAVQSRRMPPRRGVVRLKNLRGYYALKILGPNKVKLDYQVDADPGGWIPRWVGKITARRALINTMHALRKRVITTRGRYDRRIARWKKLERRLSEQLGRKKSPLRRPPG